MSTITYNDAQDRIEVQQRIFYDDLERSFRNKLDDEKFDIINPNSKITLDSILTDYINSSIDFVIDNKNITLALLEYEFTEDAIVIYSYASDVRFPKKVSLHSSLLFELFDDQTNVVSVNIGGKKKSGKFSFGSKALEIEYSVD